MILVTGGAGQVATALAERAEVHHAGRPAFDFDRPATIASTLQAAAPSLVVNAAAWTAVDLAETEPEAARRANAEGPGTLARLCAASGIPLIHISTDYVFDGEKGAPYTETDPPSPTGIYGRSKLEGEQAVLDAGGPAVILRTSWVYSPVGKNFVRTMLGAALRTDTLKVVADQKGCPTEAGDLADAILAIAARIAAGWQPEFGGVFNAAGTGSATWFELATATFRAAAPLGRPVPKVVPIATADWPTPARRPADSRLDCSKLQRVFGVSLPDWQPSLVRTVGRIVAAS